LRDDARVEGKSGEPELGLGQFSGVNRDPAVGRLRAAAASVVTRQIGAVASVAGNNGAAVGGSQIIVRRQREARAVARDSEEDCEHRRATRSRHAVDSRMIE
jgi:hypothetical protein